MISIYNAYALSVDFKNVTKNEVEFHYEVLKMICDILYQVKDIYINLHCCQTLSILCKSFISLKNEIIPIILELLIKLSNPNIGIDDSACLYLGQGIFNVLQIYQKTDQSCFQIIQNCVQRILNCKIPNVIKGLSLPVNFFFGVILQDNQQGYLGISVLN